MNLSALSAVANSVRSLTIDAVEKAKSGHPGLPLGCAELGALVYGELLNHWPGDPRWINRDRFVLSAGHGCMLLYSLLHLSGYDLSLDDIKSFRQLGSRTPGHPEWGHTPGVEATAGPLGQGLANAVGMAIAERILAAKFNTPARKVIDHVTYVLASDGDMMEGVASEAASVAGHLGLAKLIVFYDSNQITIEGKTDLAFSENVLKRYEGYGWRALDGSMYDLPAIMSMAEEARKAGEKPTIIRLQSTIGKSAPTKAGTAKVHGEPLGPEEAAAAKKAIGVPDGCQFYVFPEAAEYFRSREKSWKSRYDEWNSNLASWKAENSELAKEWDRYFGPAAWDVSSIVMPAFKQGESLATRAASGQALNALAKAVPNLVGGSADLAPSNSTNLKDMGDFSRTNPLGRNFHFGIREHGMGGICNGIMYHGGLRPFCATFLVFSDYMRPSVRLAAIAKLPVIYLFTHDSVFVGEDGPTHEPVEHLAALRAIPNLLVLRPGDAEETELAWRIAYERQDGPTVLALTRQGLPVYPKSDAAWRSTIRKGAYIAKDSAGAPDVVIVATGSEVSVALAAAAELSDRKVRVVSMLSRELFAGQSPEFRASLVPASARTVVFEAGVTFGWKTPFDDSTLVVGIDRYGASGPYQKIAELLGITSTALAKRIRDGK
ncbi:MAG TPA: transketolase [Spirochaetia bacterium]|nr:transketolase [Spirochaetia bacterium]